MKTTKIEFPFPGEKFKLNPKHRSKLGGQFIELSNGFAHYELAGPETGELVVLVHGFSVPNFIWEPTFEALLSAGFRVLRYDLFGRGYSDRPIITYNKELFDQQLFELLEALEFNKPVQIVGLSMGGIITSNFAIKHPEKVSKIALIDPAGFPIEKSWLMKLMLIRGLGEILFGLAGNATMKKSMAADFYDPNLVEDFIRKYQPQMTYKGFKRAILSTLRSDILNNSADLFKDLGQGKLPILLIWGREDKTVPFSHSNKFLSLIPQIEFHPIEEVGHIPHYEKPEIVNPILVEFLKRQNN